jgi:uncharacterized protein (TIGR03085 family)
VTGQPLDQREREELCDLFLQLGPDAPTLCEGWDVLDLAAHLAIREREPVSAVGILVPRFASFTENRQERRAAAGLPALVDVLRTPPLVPWRVPGLRTVLNLTEWVVHHEDVRRANGMGPRLDRDDLEDAVWKLLAGSARMATRTLDGGLVLERSDTRERRVVKDRSPAVVLVGRPVDLALYLTGRKANAAVELLGPEDAVAAVRSAPFGL